MTPVNRKISKLLTKIELASQRIEMDGYDSVTFLEEELRNICPHITKRVYDVDVLICTTCHKLFRKAANDGGE